jgi:hypothetical protein
MYNMDIVLKNATTVSVSNLFAFILTAMSMIKNKGKDIPNPYNNFASFKIKMALWYTVLYTVQCCFYITIC